MKYLLLVLFSLFTMFACTKKHPAELAMNEFIQATCDGNQNKMESRVDFENLAINSLNLKGITENSTQAEKDLIYRAPQFLFLKNEFFKMFLEKKKEFCTAKVVKVSDIAEKLTLVRIADNPDSPNTFLDATVSQCSEFCRMIAFKLERAK